MTSPTKVTFPAMLSKVETMSDKGTKLVFNTRELGQDNAILFKMAHAEGWLLFSSNELKEDDIPDELPGSMLSPKTQAQRLRGVLYKLWQIKGEQGLFEDYYKRHMELIIDKVKEQLDGGN